MRFAILLAAAVLASAQPNQTNVFSLTHTETVTTFQEIVTAVRGLTGITELSADTAQKSITVRGTAGQVALAGWLVNQLDSPQPADSSAVAEYLVTDGKGEVVRLFSLANAATTQQMQEIATIVRSVGDIRLLFVCFGPKAVIMRGTPVQAAMTQFLIHELDQAAAQPASAQPELRVPGATDDIIRIFFLKNPSTPQELQEVITLMRSIGDIQRIFAYNADKAIAMRGSVVQAELAIWLVSELDQPSGTQDTARHEYRMPPGREDLVRVFYLAPPATPEELWSIVTRIRTEAQIQRLFVYKVRNAIAARGNAAQIAIAEQLLEQRKSAAAQAAR